jgi:2-amino-4-hydroxy-6-hydroxymethyldihydropteridine diphosphokinase
MSLIISTGTNLGNRLKNLEDAKQQLSIRFELIEESRIYSSKAVDYLDQPDFLNQILAFKTPQSTPMETIEIILELEAQLGRKREIARGPRNIDIDILFWNFETIDCPQLQVPHPRLFERSFIVLPLKEMSIFKTLGKEYEFPLTFTNSAEPLS